MIHSNIIESWNLEFLKNSNPLFNEYLQSINAAEEALVDNPLIIGFLLAYIEETYSSYPSVVTTQNNIGESPLVLVTFKFLNDKKYVMSGANADLLESTLNILSHGNLTSNDTMAECWAWFSVLPEEDQSQINEVLKYFNIIPSTANEEDEALVNTAIENSNTIREESSRFSAALWFDKVKKLKVTIAGLGGIGSYTAFLIARCYPQFLYIIDPDTVESANLSGQLFGTYDIGNTKVSAVRDFIYKYTNTTSVYCDTHYFTSDSHIPYSSIMICGFDSMQARREYYQYWKDHIGTEGDPKECLYIDGRLAAEKLQVFCITGDNTYAQKKYEEEYLFSDSEADETMCSYKQTSYMASMIGSIITNLFVNFVSNLCISDLRSLPFITEYNGEITKFKITEV